MAAESKTFISRREFLVNHVSPALTAIGFVGTSFNTLRFWTEHGRMVSDMEEARGNVQVLCAFPPATKEQETCLDTRKKIKKMSSGEIKNVYEQEVFPRRKAITERFLGAFILGVGMKIYDIYDKNLEEKE